MDCPIRKRARKCHLREIQGQLCKHVNQDWLNLKVYLDHECKSFYLITLSLIKKETTRTRINTTRIKRKKSEKLKNKKGKRPHEYCKVVFIIQRKRKRSVQESTQLEK